jgi:hypothetical protein
MFNLKQRMFHWALKDVFSNVFCFVIVILGFGPASPGQYF